MRLRQAIGPSYRKLEGARNQMAALMRSICGPNYGEQNDCETRPVNITWLWTVQMLQNLSSANPQVLCLTHATELKSAAREMQLALNQTLKRMEFSAEHKRFVLGMLLGVGIMQVGLETRERRVVDEEELPLTSVFVESIALEDFVLDMTANKWDMNQVTFCGHRYRMPLLEIRNNPDFDKEERERCTEREAPTHERLETISKGQSEIYDKFTDMGELWSIFVPEEREVVTFMASEQGKAAAGGKALRTVRWTGPEHGPYHWAGFLDVINNVLPLPPAANLVESDDLVNKLYVQCGKDASQAKSVLVASSSAKKDAEEIRDAEPWQILISDNPGATQVFTLGGVNPNSLTMAMNAKDITSYMAGNLDAIAGLSQQAGTLGQEEIIKSSSSASVQALHVAVTNATGAIIRDVAFYLHKHPQEQMELTLDIPGTKLTQPITWPMQTDEYGTEFDSREGRFDQYEIDIVPYSSKALTPGERGQQLERIYQQYVLPIETSGLPPPPSLERLLAKLARLYGMPEITELYDPAANYDQQQRAGMGEGMRKPTVTSRNYTRTSFSGGASPLAHSQQMQAALLGAGGVGNV